MVQACAADIGMNGKRYQEKYREIEGEIRLMMTPR